MYLNNRDSLKSNHPLELSSKSAVIKTGLEMMRRLYKSEEPVQIVEQFTMPTESSSLRDRLLTSIESVHAGVSQSRESGDTFKKEFDSYDRHQERGPLLEKFFDALCSVQPTSTQSERNFSLAAGIGTKKRTKMSSDKFHACCFLKSYFSNKN